MDRDEIAPALRALPEREPPPGLLQAIEARIDAEPAPRAAVLPMPARLAASRPRWLPAGIAAMAATVVLAVGTGWPGDDAALVPVAGPQASAPVPAGVTAIQARSQVLEQQLLASQAVNAGSGAATGQPATASVVLQARLADLDEQLNNLLMSGQAGPEAEVLWRQRVALMQSLVEVQQPTQDRVYMF